MESQKTIGIIGGGQLGRMLTLAALPLGFKVVVLEAKAGGPAAQAGAQEIIGGLYDAEALRRLGERADFVTAEIEHIDAATLEAMAKSGVPINPAPATIRLIKDKFAQKEFLQAQGIPVAPFAEITDEASAQKLLKKFGGKMLVKTRHGAYDGRGNMVVTSQQDLAAAFKLFGNAKLYAEAFVPFAKELAVMVVRDLEGRVTAYPVVETVHQRNICLEVIAPAEVDSKVQKAAERLALKTAKRLEGAGVFGIELFLTKEGKVLVNEIAPRVHNSGHYTMDACQVSQFEQHIRAVSGLPLGSTDLCVPAAVMVNILGERDGPAKIEGLADALAISGVSVHLYGKSPTKVDRKMGHLTATGPTAAIAKKRAHTARKKVSV
jgi:5-(carboxyamino)imidazole ribonucleotide synthase